MNLLKIDLQIEKVLSASIVLTQNITDEDNLNLRIQK